MNNQLEGSDLGLHLLTARFDQAQHGAYVAELVAAIKEPSLRNIAITGAYGTGKSSVLREVAVRFPGRVAEISLSSVGVSPQEPGDGKRAPSGSDQAIVADIQKEIVKQLLYVERPSRMRGSRYDRIQRLGWPRVAVGAGLASLLVVCILYVTGWAKPLIDLAPSAPVGYGVGFLVIAALVLWAARWAQGRFTVGEVKTGVGSVALARQSDSYFDKYLDEIVYFFEVSRRDVVIFEDLDRFNNVEIFESLRALNTLINASEQVRRRRRRLRERASRLHLPSGSFRVEVSPVPAVKFLYALKDSLFEGIEDDVKRSEGDPDAARDEVRRANRTKFFDLVVPVVPFITHRNARDIMTQATQGTNVSKRLVAVAARHLADKRLIDNIANEYKVFAYQLIDQKFGVPDLTEDELFALIVYKNVQMSDFENIRLGESDLDDLHTAFRELVEANVDEALKKTRDLSTRLGESAQVRSARLGNRLRRYLLAIQNVNGYGVGSSITVDGRPFTRNDLDSPELWRGVTEGSTVVVGTNRAQVTVGLSAVVGDDLATNSWDQGDQEEQRQILQNALRNLEFLRHCSWQELYDRTEFKHQFIAGGEAESFREVAKRLLHSALAVDLVAAGFIDDFYAFYISQYYGTHASKEAWSFMVRTIDRGEPNFDFQLTPADVAAILNDRGPGFLEDSATFNIAIVDHLISTHQDDLVAKVADQVSATWSREGKEFTTRFITRGDGDQQLDPGSAGKSDARDEPEPGEDHAVEFIQVLAFRLPAVVEFVARVSLSRERRIQLLDAALSHQDLALPSLERNEAVVELALASYHTFPSLTKATTGRPTTMQVLHQIGIRLPSLHGLSPLALVEATRLGMYDITPANIEALTEGPSMALDDVRESKPAVYSTILKRMPEYLGSLDPRVHVTVGKEANFAGVLEDLDEAGVDPANMRAVVSRAKEGLRIEDLSDVPPQAWGALAHDRRTTATAISVLAYLDEYGSIDSDLASMVTDSHHPFKVSPDTTGPDRLRLALAFITAGAELLDASTRASLAAAADPPDYIALDALTPETGPLMGLLIEHDLIDDSKEIFASALVPDWLSREQALRSSTKVATFIGSDVVPADQLGAFFASPVLSDDLKRLLAARIGDYTTEQLAPSVREVAEFARVQQVRLDSDQLAALRRAGLSGSLFVELLSHAKLPLGELRAFLRGLDGIYPDLAEVGHGFRVIEDTEAHRLILDQLRGQVVSSFTPFIFGRVRVNFFQSDNS